MVAEALDGFVEEERMAIQVDVVLLLCGIDNLPRGHTAKHAAVLASLHRDHHGDHHPHPHVDAGYNVTLSPPPPEPEPPADAAIGERVMVEGMDGDALTPNQLKKKKAWEAVSPELKMVGGVATFRGQPIVTSAGACTTPTVVEGKIS